MLENYRRSRATTAKSMHRWLDALIADAEERLLALEAGSEMSAAPPPPAAPPTPASPNPLRSTYPFDENAPRQRPN